MKLPTLYKRTTTGAQQEWAVSVEGNVIVTRWGQTGGSIQEGRDTIKTGKNIGRSNETTPEEQAELEAKALWEKKKKKRGYHEDADAAMDGKDNDLIEGGIFPMLAHKYWEQGHKIKWPAYVQPKLDGHRCIAIIKNGKASLWTRTRKPILCLPHITARFEELVAGDAIFDGELYNHAYRDDFEKLTSFIRQQTKPKPGHEVVQYHIYDFPHEAGFGLRSEALASFFAAVGDCPTLRLVETVKAETPKDLDKAYEEFLEQGYEGAMVRNEGSQKSGGYLNSRSYDLQKVKIMDDSEFEVLGVKEGRGKLAGHAMFIMEHKGAEFRAKMKGKLSELKKYLKDPSLAVGRVVTVQYQGFTKTNNVPRFPVVLRFRKDI
jgi:ATP-dependent DNA ligase